MFYFLITGSAGSALLSAAFTRKAIVASQNNSIGWMPGIGAALSFGCAALLGTMAAVQPVQPTVTQDKSIIPELGEKYLTGREKALEDFRNQSIQVGTSEVR